MFELKITIGTTPDLGAALNRLADVLSSQYAPDPAPVLAIDGRAIAGPVVPAPAVPVAQSAAPTYTKEQVASAGAMLIQSRPEMRDALIGLLKQFGVNAINNLPDEHLGAFATALRQLGAAI